MTKSIKSIISTSGGLLVEVECHLSNNLPNISIIGFASKSVDEAKDRLRASFTNSGLTLPKKHITLNLSPADVPKEATALDLAMAVAILSHSQQVDPSSVQDSIFLGELGLGGELKPVRGIIGALLASKKIGFRRFYIPEGNLKQAALIPEAEVFPIRNLRELYGHLSGTRKLKKVTNGAAVNIYGSMPANEQAVDFSEITGQSVAKRALEIAAAGNHNVLMSGPPGVGKTLLARALTGILPPLKPQEVIEATHLHSLASHAFDGLILYPPLRSPHHNASISSLVGGGSRPLPGEVSLAHRGILFLDEVPEFSRAALEALRQPMEDRRVTVSRVKESAVYPAEFLLVATQNPCPCGYFGSARQICTCSMAAILNYQRKLSGPLLDRIDLHVTTENIEHRKLLEDSSEAESSSTVAARVARARAIQHLRFSSERHNSSMSSKEIRQFAKLDEEAKSLLDEAAEKLGLSARAYLRCVKVARTIADLEGQQDILREHLAEALQYRAQNSSLTPVT